jgi:K+ transporter
MRKLWNEHPNLASWIVLAIGMVVIVIFAARDVGFQPGQWAAVIAATIALAGLCVWIISWEDSPNSELSPRDEDSLSGKEQDAA